MALSDPSVFGPYTMTNVMQPEVDPPSQFQVNIDEEQFVFQWFYEDDSVKAYDSFLIQSSTGFKIESTHSILILSMTCSNKKQ